MQVNIESVVIRRRIRKSLGDLGPLMESLRTHGQLTPILISRRGELIAGNRRLKSARRLGWKSINAVVVDDATERKSLELEIEENVQRKQLTQDELQDGLMRLEHLRNPGLLRRVLIWIRSLLRRFLSLFQRRDRG